MTKSASEQIDERIADLGDWRAETLSRMRKLIKEADPDVVEEFKWVKRTSPGTPVWADDGIICTGESYKGKVKLTFAKGASLDDPAGPLQLEPRREREARDRHPRGGGGRRRRVQGARPCRGRAEQRWRVAQGL